MWYPVFKEDNIILIAVDVHSFRLDQSKGTIP